MKVKSKIILITIISILASILLNIFTLRTFITQNLYKQEIIQAGENYERAKALFNKEEATLESTLLDWAKWDDTYQFIQDKNEIYVDSNLQDSTLETLKLNIMFFIDNNGNIIIPKVFNFDSQDRKMVVSELEKKLKLKEEYNTILSASEPISGTLMLFGKPILISMSPVTTSDGKAPPNGILVFGRTIDEEFIKYLEKVLQVELKIKDQQAPEFNITNKQNYHNFTYNDSEIWVERTEDEIKTYAVLDDIWGSPEIFLVFNSQRELYKSGTKAIFYLSIFFFVIFGLVGFFCMSVVEKLITNRLKKLYVFMEKVGTNIDTKARIFLPGNDEISRLAVNTNVMLEELDKYYSDIKIVEERFRLIMEATNDGYFDANIIKNEIYISKTWLKYLGHEDSESFINLNGLLNMIYSADKELFRSSLKECLSTKVEHLRVEYRMLNNSGQLIWVEVRGKIVEYNRTGRPVRFIGTISDITNRKKYEEENLYLSQTDLTTTLKNRAYMEKILKKADECNQCGSWIIMGDVNGLKLINDTFGHQDGDRLLRVIGEILKNTCSNDHIPARWGGDEFVIFIKDKDESSVKKLISRIKNECEAVSDYPIKISIALGSAQKDSKNINMDAVLKSAEERMYRNKLLESRSARSAILASLEQTLHEKSIETEEHTKRIKHMCLLIGRKMGLTEDELDELTLLGSLHDIGKIGIPEAVLLKPGKLTKQEWEIMKTHSEIGYRIAGATPELTHIAEKILSHHERYDGTGYPQGLKGTEIPKLSRLISIADSFDVMTHDRHYKKAMSIEKVVQELKECSGKQFDPDMIESFLALLEEHALDIFNKNV